MVLWKAASELKSTIFQANSSIHQLLDLQKMRLQHLYGVFVYTTYTYAL